MEIEPLPQIMLACQVPEVLEIMIDGHEGCTVDINNETFTLFPERENEVYLRGFRALVRQLSAVKRSTEIDVYVLDLETEHNARVNFTVYACDVEMDAEDADAIRKGNRFLTCGNEKRTYATAKATGTVRRDQRIGDVQIATLLHKNTAAAPVIWSIGPVVGDIRFAVRD